MLARWLASLILLAAVACGGAEQSSEAVPEPQAVPQQLILYANSVETRLFANPAGFELPDDVSLQRTLNRREGVALSPAEAAIVSRSVSVIPPPNEVASCAHFWRHVFVFYDSAGAPVGALAYCMECGAVTIIGPEDPDVYLEQLRYDGAELKRIIENHGMLVEPEYPE